MSGSVKARSASSSPSPTTHTDAAVFYDQFRRHAQRFVSLVERGEAIPTSSFLIEVVTALAELCAIALTLPEIETQTETQTDLDVTAPSVVETLARRLGDADAHWEVSDPTKKTEPVRASLAEDIAGIYRDLKRGLLLTAHGASTTEVLRHWRKSFNTRWGMKATGAMRAIYWALHHRTCEVESRSLAPGAP
ncbi:MAG: DUF5063 domain-containing protein [bacterium]